EYDPQGPWRQIASGITATGLAMAWPVDDGDRQGLLPDYFLLESQQRDGPAINPGTAQAHIAELFDAGTIYDVRRVPGTGCFIHAPCRIHQVVKEDEFISFTLDGWGARQGPRAYHVLVSGWSGRRPDVTVCERDEGTDTSEGGMPASAEYLPLSKLLVIDVAGPVSIGIRGWMSFTATSTP
ncbi:MAG: hypothetical protein ACM3VT_01875, partial [Solirubrobacterales bacterium]